MTAQQQTRQGTTREQMDALVTATTGPRKQATSRAIVEGFAADAEHDVVGRPGEHSTAAIKSRASTAPCSPSSRIDRFEPSDAGTATTT